MEISLLPLWFQFPPKTSKGILILPSLKKKKNKNKKEKQKNTHTHTHKTKKKKKKLPLSSYCGLRIQLQKLRLLQRWGFNSQPRQ